MQKQAKKKFPRGSNYYMTLKDYYTDVNPKI